MLEVFLADEEATLQLGAQLAACLSESILIYLSGDLGAGKTTLTRAMLRALGISDHIKSPTFSMVECYERDKQPLYHIDLYRLTNPEELEYLGLQDLMGTNAIIMIEWPERAGDYLPKADVHCYLSFHKEGRLLKMEPNSDQGKKILEKVKAWQ